MTISDLLIRIAAVWYISYCLVSTQGPVGVFLRLRNWRGGRWHGRRAYAVYSGGGVRSADAQPENTQVLRKTELHGLLDCQVCLAVWVALIVMLVPAGVLLDALGVAGVGLWVHSYSGWRANY
jgi:hypothetical protein